MFYNSFSFFFSYNYWIFVERFTYQIFDKGAGKNHRYKHVYQKEKEYFYLSNVIVINI
jgi:hypothetical protein